MPAEPKEPSPNAPGQPGGPTADSAAASPEGSAGTVRDPIWDELRIEPLPAAALLAEARRLSRARRARDDVFGHDLFLNPAWNILLELFIAAEEGRNVTIKSACVASGVPQSTALRHIAHLVDIRLAVRHVHPSDARSAYLKLTERGRAKMAAFISLSGALPEGTGA